jgi:hypothetical protein
MNEDAYLNTTLELMKALGLHIRDTFDVSHNLDDYYSNGDRFCGPRLLKIEWNDSAVTATASANKKYEIPGRQAIAYDAYKIVVPTRFQTAERDDPVVHECVHFLQHTTTTEDSSYIPATNQPLAAYLAYISQRVELEAHLVQIAYISKSCGNYMSSVLSAYDIADVHRMLAACAPGALRQPTLALVTYCKTKNLI